MRDSSSGLWSMMRSSSGSRDCAQTDSTARSRSSGRLRVGMTARDQHVAMIAGHALDVRRAWARRDSARHRRAPSLAQRARARRPGATRDALDHLRELPAARARGRRNGARRRSGRPKARRRCRARPAAGRRACLRARPSTSCRRRSSHRARSSRERPPAREHDVGGPLELRVEIVDRNRRVRAHDDRDIGHSAANACMHAQDLPRFGAARRDRREQRPTPAGRRRRPGAARATLRPRSRASAPAGFRRGCAPPSLSPQVTIAIGQVGMTGEARRAAEREMARA